MKEIKDLKTAFDAFEEASSKQAEATESGDYRKGNKYYDRIIESINFIKSKEAIAELLKYLDSTNIGVRLWAAYYLLPVHEEKSKKVLEAIANGKGIHSLTAETTLSEWRKGNLKI